MSNKKQTAVNWLIEQLIEKQNGNGSSVSMDDLFNQAKQIEKEHIKTAFNEGFRQGELTEIPEGNKPKDISLFNDAENYYTETYEN